jgi:hypothetical protein
VLGEGWLAEGFVEIKQVGKRFVEGRRRREVDKKTGRSFGWFRSVAECLFSAKDRLFRFIISSIPHPFFIYLISTQYFISN